MHAHEIGAIGRYNKTISRDLKNFVSRVAVDRDQQEALACYRYNTGYYVAIGLKPFNKMQESETFKDWVVLSVSENKTI